MKNIKHYVNSDSILQILMKVEKDSFPFTCLDIERFEDKKSTLDEIIKNIIGRKEIET